MRVRERMVLPNLTVSEPGKFGPGVKPRMQQAVETHQGCERTQDMVVSTGALRCKMHTSSCPTYAAGRNHDLEDTEHEVLELTPELGVMRHDVPGVRTGEQVAWYSFKDTDDRYTIPDKDGVGIEDSRGGLQEALRYEA
jgi:hypothetical protein